MTKNLHTVLEDLKAELRTDFGHNCYTLAKAVLSQLAVTSYGREMRLSALDALDNVLDVALNSGTVENLFELRASLENGAGEFGPSLDHDEISRLLPELWNFSYKPDDIDRDAEEPLDAVICAWNTEIGYAAHSVLVSHIETVFPEYNF